MHDRTRGWRLWSVLGAMTAGSLLVFPGLVSAHGGAGLSIQDCRIPVDNRWLRLTAYTPALTQDIGYCRAIPEAGQTRIVLDFGSKTPAKIAVEIEVTKEPDGTRIYYQARQTHSARSIDALVNFADSGSGDYMVHVTLAHEGKRTHTYLPISVGSKQHHIGEKHFKMLMAVSGSAAIFYFPPAPTRKGGGMIREASDALRPLKPLPLNNTTLD